MKEVPGLYCSIDFPHAEFTTGRALRTSPIFPKLLKAGAQFGQVGLHNAGQLKEIKQGGFISDRCHFVEQVYLW